jgi:uncharacterized protein (DUF433 family)
MASVAVNHVVFDEQGVPYIGGTRTKVVEIIADFYFWAWTPEIIHREYPYLSLAQIHSAFAYYYDHKQEIDAEIQQRDRDMERLAAAQPESPGRKKLRDLGLKP